MSNVLFSWPDELTPPKVCVASRAYDLVPALADMPRLPDKLHTAVPKRQAEFLAGRWCAQMALAKIGKPDAEVPIGPDRAPVWPGGIVGSITHSDGFAAAMVARNTDFMGIGIDIERVMSDAEAASLSRQIATAAEWALLTRTLAPSLAFALLFSAKEAMYKAIYPTVQRFVGFTEVTCSGRGDGRLDFDLPDDIVATLGDVRQLPVRFVLTPARVVAVCSLPRTTS